MSAEKQQITRLAREIIELSPEDLERLRAMIERHRGDDGGIGVREPRRPSPPDDEDSIALEPDYWETAQ